MHENGVAVDQDFHMAKRYYDLALETNQEAYLPVKLSLIKLRIRHFWNRITNGNVNPIQDEKGKHSLVHVSLYLHVAHNLPETKAPRTLKEWIITFLENDEEEEAQYRAQLYGQGVEDDEEGLLGTRRAENEDSGYYDELELDIDESVLEGLIILALAATLLILVYVRQQRNRQRENENAPGQPAAENGGNNDRGFFPRPGEPEFGQWVAGGVGH
jgi:SEL1 protein